MADTRYNVGRSGADVVEILDRAAHGGELDVTILAINNALLAARYIADTAIVRADAAQATADAANNTALAAATAAAENAAQIALLWAAIYRGGADDMVYNGLSIKGSYMKTVDLYGLTESTIDTGLGTISRVAVFKVGAVSSSGGGGESSYSWTRGPSVAEGGLILPIEGAKTLYAGHEQDGSGSSAQIYDVTVTVQISGASITLTRTDTSGAPANIQPADGEYIMLLCIEDY